MRTITRIGSALKRAALYVPRKIANRLQRTKMAVASIQNMPGYCVKISVKGKRVEKVRIYKKGFIQKFESAPIATGVVKIEDEAVGPFASTTKPVTQSWPIHDQDGYFGKPQAVVQRRRFGAQVKFFLHKLIGKRY
jgi:hypothetical protein